MRRCKAQKSTLWSVVDLSSPWRHQSTIEQERLKLFKTCGGYLLWDSQVTTVVQTRARNHRKVDTMSTVLGWLVLPVAPPAADWAAAETVPKPPIVGFSGATVQNFSFQHLAQNSHMWTRLYPVYWILKKYLELANFQTELNWKGIFIALL